MCETRDLCIQWHQWHTSVDMRVFCPQDVKKMLPKQARIVYWTTWAIKHGCEEFKEGVWLEPVRAMLPRKTCEPLTDEHLKVVRKLVVRIGAVRSVRDWLVGRKEVSRLWHGRRHGETQAVPWSFNGGHSETRSQRAWGNGD